MDKGEIAAFSFMGAMIGLVIAAAIGWGMNIYKLATMGLEPVGLLVLRIVGIFIAPLGAIIGYFG